MKFRRQNFCQKSDDQLKVLDQQESVWFFLTDSEKSKKLTAELSSVNDKVSNKGVVRKQQELVAKESKAFEETLDKVRRVEYKLEKKQLELEEEQLRSNRESMQ